jgi:hypothetical protein
LEKTRLEWLLGLVGRKADWVECFNGPAQEKKQEQIRLILEENEKGNKKWIGRLGELGQKERRKNWVVEVCVFLSFLNLTKGF